MNRSALMPVRVWLLVACCGCQIAFAESPASSPTLFSASAPSSIGREAAAGEKLHPQAVSPFSGEPAVGVGMLAMHGPSILVLSSSVAKMTVALGSILNTTKEPSRMAVAIGDRLGKLLGNLLGPLSLSSGVARDGVAGLSSHLLEVAKSLPVPLSSSIESVLDTLSRSLTMSREVERLADRGLNLSKRMKTLADDSRKELGNILRGGEVQVFRDGAANVAARLGRRADANIGAFNQMLTNTGMTTAILEEAKVRLEKALHASGKPANGARLFDLGISAAELGKQLIDARKYLASAHGVLIAADASVGGLHEELLTLLAGIKADLDALAAARGVDPATLARATKDLEAVSGDDLALAEEIGLLVDEMVRLNPRPAAKVEPDRELASESDSKPDSDSESQSETESESEANRKSEPVSDIETVDQLYDKMVSAYRAFLVGMATAPGDPEAIDSARAAFEKADSAFRAKVRD